MQGFGTHADRAVFMKICYIRPRTENLFFIVLLTEAFASLLYCF
jgi:hypothetical protein